MLSKLRAFVYAMLLLSPMFLSSQSVNRASNCPGVPGACGYPVNQSVQRSGPNPSPQNGNGTLGLVYTNTACGLNYATASRVLGKRFSPQGVNQPAAFSITGIPAGACILQAYLWAEGSGNGTAQTATIVNPLLVSGNYPMTIVGQGPDKCWGYAGSYTYRADVTAAIAGNGNYNISGIMTNPPTSGNDMDGATLMVIWSDASQAWRGTVRVDDGAYVVNGGIANYVMTYPAVCGATTNASAFLCVGDIQFNPTSWTLNGTPGALTWNWWDQVSVNTTVLAGQTTSAYNINTGGDCFNLCVAGLYYRTTCVACTPTILTMSSTPATCSGCNGTASVVVNPAGAYTYSWSPSGGTGSTASGLCAGTYTVTVVSGCNTYTASVVVANAGGGLTLTGTQTNVTCFGACNGTASTTVTGGTAPFTFTWSPAQANTTVGATNTASALCAGTYTISCTDANGCTGTRTITITQPPQITATQSQVNVTCFGACTGSASVVASGGTGVYTYAWAPSGGTAATATGLCAGTYTCTISSPAGCTITQSFTITQPTAVAATISTTPVLCNGGATGTASVVASGGTPGYTYSWAPSGGTAATATGLVAGTYTCTITDANGCVITRTITVTQPLAISLTMSSTQSTCGNPNGSATVAVFGGVGPYTYSWAPSGGTGSNATGLIAGTYTVTVTDANACTQTGTVTVVNAGSPTATISSSTNITCFGGNNGSATVSASGGTGPYSYAWAPSGGTGTTASTLIAGSYTVTVTDANGCTTTASVVLTQPPVITATQSQVNVNCFGACNGSASVVASGGTGTYTYAWSPSGGTAATATGLCAGTYTCTISSPVGCFITQSFTITQPTAVSATISTTPVLCNGGSTGTATVAPSGGVGPYTYSWAPSGGTAATATGLAAGTYTCTITDANGCVITRTITVTQPLAISLTMSSTQSTCGNPNGSATVAVFGGVGPYTYSWAPTGGTGSNASGLLAGTYTVTVTDANACTQTGTVTVVNAGSPSATISASTNILCFGGNNGSATVTASGGTGPYSYAWAPSGGTGTTASTLIAGSYTVTVTDANGCTATASIVLTQPPALNASASSTPVLCNAGNTGSATVIATGGAPGYTYNWAPSGGTGATANSLTATTYTCTVTDANGCTVTATTTVTQPTQLTATIATTPVLCNGGNTGTATVVASNATPGYTYSWAPSGGTAATATGLTAGNYTCTITDANGCVITQSITVTQPTAISLATSFVQSTCGNPNGSASVVASGGIGPYTYSWAPSGGNAATANGLLSGSYTVTVTDANLCTSTATVAVPNAGSPVATITSSTNVLCFGGNNGDATVTVTGAGTPPYTYAWTPIGGTGSTGTGLIAGSYTVTVTDVNGCSATASIIITEPPVLTIVGSSTNVDCFGNATGSATVVISGGATPYAYSWTPSGGSNATAPSLTAGSYTCTATDANGCIITQSLTVTEPPLLTLAVAGFNVSCFNACDGQLVVIPTGGVTNYSFSWSTGCTAPSCNNICAGSYTVIVTDANGCVATASTTVTQPTAISIVTSEVDAHCNQADGSASAVGSGGTGTLVYQWINGPTNANYNNIVPNTYSVIVTDANGCADTATATVNNLNGVNASLTSVTNLTCFNSNNGSIVTNATGGISPYTYSWTAPAVSVTGTASSLSAGNYTLTVTDSSGCSSTVTATVTEPTDVTITASATPPVVCSGTGVQLSTVAAGGTPGYTYSWTPGPLPGNTQNIVPTATTTYTAYVVDANGCSDSTTVLVTVNPVPVSVLLGDVLSGCAPVCVNFSDMSTIAAPGVINSWSWDFGDGSLVSTQQNPTHCFADPGSYTITLNINTTDGCAASIVMPSYITVFANPVAAFGASPQPATMLNPQITFTDSSINASTWFWSFGDITNASSTLQNPTFEYPDPTCYQVMLAVASVDGCVDTTSREVCIQPDVTLFVPNAFTPNDDGKNDLFMPYGIGIDPDHFEMWIFDRWGNMIFYTDDLAKGWDGKVQGHSEVAQVDTYIWKIKAIDLLGSKHNIEGKVSLIK